MAAIEPGMDRSFALLLFGVTALIVSGILGLYAAMKLAGYPVPHGSPFYVWSPFAIRLREAAPWTLLLPLIAGVAAAVSDFASSRTRWATAMCCIAVLLAIAAPFAMLSVIITEPRRAGLLIEIGPPTAPVHATADHRDGEVHTSASH